MVFSFLFYHVVKCGANSALGQFNQTQVCGQPVANSMQTIMSNNQTSRRLGGFYLHPKIAVARSIKHAIQNQATILIDKYYATPTTHFNWQHIHVLLWHLTECMTVWSTLQRPFKALAFEMLTKEKNVFIYFKMQRSEK